MRRSWIAVVVLTLAAQVLSAQNGTSVSAARLRADLFRLAADSMMGREPGSLGNARAADYVAAEFRRLGLEPAGDSGTYFQRVPLAVDHPSADAELDAEGVRLRAMSDFLPVVWLAGGRFGSSARRRSTAARPPIPSIGSTPAWPTARSWCWM